MGYHHPKQKILSHTTPHMPFKNPSDVSILQKLGRKRLIEKLERERLHRKCINRVYLQHAIDQLQRVIVALNSKISQIRSRLASRFILIEKDERYSMEYKNDLRDKGISQDIFYNDMAQEIQNNCSMYQRQSDTQVRLLKRQVAVIVKEIVALRNIVPL